MMIDPVLAHGDADLERAISRFMQRTTPKPGVGLRNLHALTAQLGSAGTGTMSPGVQAVIPVVKPCRIIEWTLDGNLSGNVDMTVEYSPWAIPRAWASITTNPLTIPALAASAVAGSGNLNGWTLLLDRKGAIRVVITGATTTEQVTIVFYVQDLVRGALIPEEA